MIIVVPTTVSQNQIRVHIIHEYPKPQETQFV